MDQNKKNSVINKASGLALAGLTDEDKEKMEFIYSLVDKKTISLLWLVSRKVNQGKLTKRMCLDAIEILIKFDDDSNCWTDILKKMGF